MGPGGPPGLQNQCAGDELAGGFDSHALLSSCEKQYVSLFDKISE